MIQAQQFFLPARVVVVADLVLEEQHIHQAIQEKGIHQSFHRRRDADWKKIDEEHLPNNLTSCPNLGNDEFTRWFRFKSEQKQVHWKNSSIIWSLKLGHEPDENLYLQSV